MRRDGCLGLPWKKYPAGADVLLFQGTMHICVGQNKETKKWWAYIMVEPAAGGGALFVDEYAPSQRQAIMAAEVWLKRHMEDLMKNLGSVR